MWPWTKKHSPPPDPSRGLPRSALFINTELLMALERLGFFEYISINAKFSTAETAKVLGLRPDLLYAACSFLAEENIFEKTGPDAFRLAIDYKNGLEMQNNYFLAYKSVYNNFADLLNGSKIYGKDVIRDASRLGFGTKRSIPFLVKRFKELGIKSGLDIGCGSGNFLFALVEAIPGFRGIGIEIDKKTIEYVEKRIDASSFKNLIKVFEGDAAHPEFFPPEVKTVEAFFSVGVFHELRKDKDLIHILNKYKKRFPYSKFFLAEIDTPDWDSLSAEPKMPSRYMVAFYLLTHYFSEQGLPQSKEAWAKMLNESNWHVKTIYELPLRLVMFECE